jgi:hypothetical protein
MELYIDPRLGLGDARRLEAPRTAGKADPRLRRRAQDFSLDSSTFRGTPEALPTRLSWFD